jgi:hypothetical protein
MKNVFYFLALIALTVVVSSLKSCSAESVYLLSEFDAQKSMFKYTYDNKNRISSIDGVVDGKVVEQYTLTYNDAGDLVQVHTYYSAWDQSDTHTFTKDGNVITVVKTSNAEYDVVEKVILNDQGLIDEKSLVYTIDEENQKIYISKYEYKDKNFVKCTTEVTDKQSGASLSYKSVNEYTYDDKKGPFFYCNTPKWWITFNYHVTFGYCNNVFSYSQDGTFVEEYEYTYNEAGFPEKMLIKKEEEDVIFKYAYIKK